MLRKVQAKEMMAGVGMVSVRAEGEKYTHSRDFRKLRPSQGGVHCRVFKDKGP